MTVIEDLVSRKWIDDIVSSEETSTEVQIVFSDALAIEPVGSGSRATRCEW